MEPHNEDPPLNPFKIFSKIIKNRKVRIGATIIYLGIFLFVFDNIYNFEVYNTEEILRMSLRILPYALIILGTGYFMFGYLEGEKSSDKETELNYKSPEQILNEFKKYYDALRHSQEVNNHETKILFERLRQQLEHQKEFSLSEQQRDDIFQSLEQAFTENINKDFFNKLNENISIELTKEKRGRLDLLLNDFSAIKIRLTGEINKLSRKANVNLVIGSLTTIVALMALGYVVFQTTNKFISLTDMLYHYVPRLSLIIFIEVFAYFFLKLYKLNLNDMKYFQNELTTVELKLASISTAINFGKDIDISAITYELAKTERNFILKKGETTVELEKNRIDNVDLKELLKTILETKK